MGVRAKQRMEPLAHLRRRLVSEGHREQFFGRQLALREQVRDTIGKYPGFARTCPRQDQDRTITGGYRLVLRRIQIVKLY